MPPIDKLLSQYSEPVRFWPGEEWQDEEARANYAAANPRPPQQLRPDERYRGAVLPFRETTDGRHEWAAPGLLQDVFDSARAVRDTSGLGLGPALPPSQMRQEEFDQVLGHGMAGAMTGVTGGLARAAVSPRLAAGEMELGAGGGRRAAAELPMTSVRGYHGTTSVGPSTEGFRRIDGGNARGDAVYFNTDPGTASRYALGDVNRVTPAGDGVPNVIPVDIQARLFNEREMIPVDTLKRIAEVQNELVRERARVAGRELHDDEIYNPREFVRGFDRAYPPRGDNVLQSLSYDANEQNEILKRLGYQGRTSRGMEGSSGADIALWDKGTARSPYTGELLYGIGPLAGGAAALTLEDILSAYGKEQ